jgi:hypothetical protein
MVVKESYIKRSIREGNQVQFNISKLVERRRLGTTSEKAKDRQTKINTRRIRWHL